MPMPSEATDYETLRFPTGVLPVRERLSLWREVIGRKFWNIDIEPLSDDPFDCEVSLRACSEFTDPRHSGSAISAIAFAAGFGDLSHFNRTFRRRYGATPSEIRAEMQHRDNA